VVFHVLNVPEVSPQGARTYCEACDEWATAWLLGEPPADPRRAAIVDLTLRRSLLSVFDPGRCSIKQRDEIRHVFEIRQREGWE